MWLASLQLVPTPLLLLACALVPETKVISE